MKKKQRLFVTLLSMMFSFSSFAYDVELNGIYYNLFSSLKTAQVTSGENLYEGDVIIPSSIVSGGVTYSVKSIGNEAFKKCTAMTSVSIPSTVTSIGNYAFWACNSLASVTLPENTTTIGDYSFNGCSKLKSIVIPQNVTYIGVRAFVNTGIKEVTYNAISATISIKHSGGDGDAPVGTIVVHTPAPGSDRYGSCFPNTVTKITIGDKVRSIPNNFVEGCTELSTIEIPENVTSIGASAFADCTSLESVIIPNSVKSMGDSSFFGCSSLTTVTLSEAITIIASSSFQDCSSLSNITIPNSVESIGEYAFSGCTSLTSMDIPNSVTNIGNESFKGCAKLEELRIPNSVTSIGEYAFFGCKGLKKVYCSITKPITCGTRAFFSSSNIAKTTLYVPSSSIASYKNTNPWSNFGSFKSIDAATYNVIYMLDGEELERVLVEEYDLITLLNAPTKEGYRFSGWSGYPENLVMPGHDVTIVGTLQEIIYRNLIYKVNGVEIKKVSVEENQPFTLIEDQEKEGYTFSGWSGYPEDMIMPDHDVIIVGTFEKIVLDTDISKLDNAIYASAKEVLIGKTFELPINMKNKDGVIAYQCDIELPEGMDFAINSKGKYIVTNSDRCDDHTVSSSLQTDGSLRIVCTSTSLSEFDGNDGIVATISVIVPETFTEGEYIVRIKNVKLSETGSKKTEAPETIATIVVSDYEEGDANGDGDIDVVDVSATIAYILGNAPEGFNTKAADIDHDGVIDVNDVTAIISIILNGK